eukprot:CAMPEP_0172560156 /NCGR_PEP_ID=MMETSP1067-20121228/87352_1 /TAXON_ID=265564 ORGANISM="Thalassiosira punctigera, Strain Tpunct2005C2" /NCGR_SAMPLE_ID=MMETSP1067 /ASSEMBLY_ACC=CAM_ASM_000444 /LENGTH=48 /DNA_ID= /DNA_START= /DNA_END= /DNA_ORIENTATION=
MQVDCLLNNFRSEGVVIAVMFTGKHMASSIPAWSCSPSEFPTMRILSL